MIVNPYSFGAAAVDPFFSNVVSLLHMDGTSGGTTFTDQIGKTWTPSNAAISTAVKKFGTGSLDLTSANASRWLSTPSHADFAFSTADFTIELWLYMTNNPTNAYMVDVGTNGVAIQFTNGRITVFTSTTGTGGALYNNGSGFTQNAWHHVAVSRNSGTMRAFFDGVQWGSQATSQNFAAAGVKIGNYGGSPGTNLPFQGYIDDVRITKGVGRYAANFTPPIAPFPDH